MKTIFTALLAVIIIATTVHGVAVYDPGSTSNATANANATANPSASANSTTLITAPGWDRNTSGVIAPPPVVPYYLPIQPQMTPDMSKKVRENAVSMFAVTNWKASNIGAWDLPKNAVSEQVTFEKPAQEGRDIAIYRAIPEGARIIEIGTVWLIEPAHQLQLEKYILSRAKFLNCTGIVLGETGVKLMPSETTKGLSAGLGGFFSRLAGAATWPYYLAGSMGGGLSNSSIGTDAYAYVGYYLVEK